MVVRLGEQLDPSISPQPKVIGFYVIQIYKKMLCESNFILLLLSHTVYKFYIFHPKRSLQERSPFSQENKQSFTNVKTGVPK